MPTCWPAQITKRMLLSTLSRIKFKIISSARRFMTLHTGTGQDFWGTWVLKSLQKFNEVGSPTSLWWLGTLPLLYLKQMFSNVILFLVFHQPPLFLKEGGRGKKKNYLDNSCLPWGEHGSKCLELLWNFLALPPKWEPTFLKEVLKQAWVRKQRRKGD